jgi:hypothetical protein
MLLSAGTPFRRGETHRIKSCGGEGGIRTPDTGFGPYNGLANRRLQPLGHLSGVCRQQFTTLPQLNFRRSSAHGWRDGCTLHSNLDVAAVASGSKLLSFDPGIEATVALDSTKSYSAIRIRPNRMCKPDVRIGYANRMCESDMQTGLHILVPTPKLYKWNGEWREIFLS